MVAELLSHERQSDEELDSLEKRAGDGEIAWRGRPGGSSVASPQPAARYGERTQVHPANAAAADGRLRGGWRDLLEWNLGRDKGSFPIVKVKCCGLLTGQRAAGSTFRGRHRPRNQQPQLPRRGAPKAVGLPASRP